MSTRESCATALWATADANEPQQRFVAQQIGVRLVTEMLLSNSRKLQFIGCQVDCAALETYGIRAGSGEPPLQTKMDHFLAIMESHG